MDAVCGAMRLHEAMPYRREEYEVDKLRIELTATFRGDRCSGVAGVPCVPIASAMCYRVERIGERHHTRGKWDAAAAEAAWVSRAVPSLVMGEHTFPELRVKCTEGFENLRASLRVGRDSAAVSDAQRRLVVNDVEEGFVNLPDVVKEGHALDRPTGAGIQPGRFADD